MMKEIWNNIIYYIDSFIGRVAEMLGGLENYRLYAFIGIMFLVALGIFLVMTGGVKDAVRSIKELRARQTDDYVQQKHNRYIADRINLKVFRSLDDAYKYSRVYTKKSRFQHTSWRFFVMTNLLSLGAAVIVFFLSLSFPYTLLAFTVTFLLRYGYIQFCRLKITAQVEDELVLFLNLLSNYSTGNTEVISTFAAIAHRFKPALRECLMECVAESQGKGGTVVALENLGRKIDSRKFKEVLKNLEMSQRYNGSFHMTAMALRRDALEHVNEKRKLTSLILQNSITLGVIIASVIGVVFMMGGLIDENPIDMVRSTAGTICITVLVGVIVWITYELMKVNKA